MLIDMHVNAAADDGSPRDPRRTLELAAQAGLDGILVVGRADQLDRAAWTAAREAEGPRVYFAVPVATDRGDFLCIPRAADDDCVPPEWTARERRQPLDEATLLGRMKDHHAAVVAVQPYGRRGKGAPTGDLVFAFDGIHAVEVRTADTDPMAADMAVEAGLGMRLPCLAGSGDRRGEPQLGRLATLFAARITTQTELVAALLSGEAWPVSIERPKGAPKGGPKGAPKGAPDGAPKSAPDGAPPRAPRGDVPPDGRKRRRRRGRGPRGEHGGPGAPEGPGGGADAAE